MCFLFLGLTGLGAIVVASVQPPAASPVTRAGAPWIDAQAPGAFDSTTTLTRYAARYQVDATVLFPLFSIPVAHRDDVGFATVVVRDLQRTSSTRRRTYELFGASFPERARGLNRMGFIREVVGHGQTGADWTAHFGALSSSSETSRAEVALDSDESTRPYTVLDGLTDRRGAVNRDVRLELSGSWPSSRAFYERLLPVWRVTEPDPIRRTSGSVGPVSMEPLGFLGIVARALDRAAQDFEQDHKLARARYPFSHKAELMYLERRGHKVDGRRLRRYSEHGLIASSATLHRIDFRILDRDGDRVQSFRLWTELPTISADGDRETVLPIGFVFKPKSFLELEAVLVSPAPTEPGSESELHTGHEGVGPHDPTR